MALIRPREEMCGVVIELPLLLASQHKHFWK